MTVLLGLAYPLVMTGFAQVAFPGRADGSLVERGRQDRRVVADRPVLRRQPGVLPEPAVRGRRRLRPAGVVGVQPRSREPGPDRGDRGAPRRGREARRHRPQRRRSRRPPGQRLRARPAHQPRVRRAAGRPRRPRARARRRHACAARRPIHRRSHARLPGRAARQRAAAQPRAATACRGEQTRARGYPRQASGLPRRRTGRGQDLRHARRGAPARRARHRRGGRVRRDPRPQAHRRRCSTGWRSSPAARVAYRGTTFEEMDVDAVLARRPKVALVDELAHTNVPGSRNAKRWQDIEELLAAGIDVITTVNIQHLESVNDVVEKITGVPQRETVPDAVVRAADQIELEDMTAEALRRRLAHGNVYAPEKVDAALSNYFRDRQPQRPARARPALDRRPGRRRAPAVPRAARHHRHLGDPRAGGRGAHRRPRGRDPDPPGGPDRRPGQRRRPARRPRRPVRRAGRSQPRARWPRSGCSSSRSAAPTTRCSATTSPDALLGLRPRRERHPAGARRQPPVRPGAGLFGPGTAPTPSASPATSTSTSSPTRQHRPRGARCRRGRGSLSTQRRLRGYVLAVAAAAPADAAALTPSAAS